MKGFLGVVLSVAVILLILFITPSIALAARLFYGAYEPQNWQLSGPGTLSATPSPGPTDNLSFNYDYRNYAPNYIWYTWNFTTTAVATETHDFGWDYSFMHCWFQAKARFYVFADGPSGRTQRTLYDGVGSGVTQMTGSSSIQVNQGYTWGFIVQGYNFDSSQILKGTVTITSTSPLQVGVTVYPLNKLAILAPWLALAAVLALLAISGSILALRRRRAN